MSKRKCCFCEKSLKNVDEKYLMHDDCFNEYKTLEKTPENLIVMSGKYRGMKYEEIKKKHSKYLSWIEKTDFEDDSPMSFLKMYHLKFNKDNSSSSQ